MARCVAIAFAALLVHFATTGCASQRPTDESEAQQPARPTGQTLRVPEHDHWQDLRDTDVAFDYVRLFESEPAAPLQIVIQVTGRLGEIGRVSSDTVTWVTNPDSDPPLYASVSIITRDRYAYDASEAAVMERQYWAVDINNDGVEDLLALGWRAGETAASVQDAQGIWQTRRVAVDDPLELRLITRGPANGQALAITDDETIAWQDVVSPEPDRYIPLLEAALARSSDLIWQDRLERALAELVSAAELDSPAP